MIASQAPSCDLQFVNQEPFATKSADPNSGRDYGCPVRRIWFDAGEGNNLAADLIRQCNARITSASGSDAKHP
jgi:hypothetical protein